jgi:hypothetical protein
MDTQWSYRVLVRTARGARALLADDIDTCLPLPRLTPLGQTAACVLGAFDLRGELVPVISLELLVGERSPCAAPTDLVLVALAANFPVGLYTPRPACIEWRPARGAPCRGEIDLRDVPLTVVGPDGQRSAETRLARFEHSLTPQALRRLEQRARRYGESVRSHSRIAGNALPVVGS